MLCFCMFLGGGVTECCALHPKQGLVRSPQASRRLLLWSCLWCGRYNRSLANLQLDYCTGIACVFLFFFRFFFIFCVLHHKGIALSIFSTIWVWRIEQVAVQQHRCIKWYKWHLHNNIPLILPPERRCRPHLFSCQDCCYPVVLIFGGALLFPLAETHFIDAKVWITGWNIGTQPI